MERFLPGMLLGSRYRVVARLGGGGMGEVYRADDLKLGQPVALKFLPAGVEQDPGRLEVLLQEVRAARQVSHLNVCRVWDVCEDGGRHFISMEYVDGEDLRSLLKRIGRLPREKALDIARQICAGLGAAHEVGIVHCDLKPANIMLDGRGRVRITDFGLARLGVEVAASGAAAGTPAYMAPELLEGRGATVQSEVYALGLVLYELFTGRHAFAASNIEDLRRLQREVTPASPSSHVEGLDPAVERAILRCLATDPAARPRSVLAVAAAFPGGDALAAALARGETPSPEMVAAAGHEGTLAPARAWSLLASAVMCTIAAVTLTARSQGLDSLPFTQSPDVFRHRSLEILRTLGLDGSRHEAWWEDLDDAYIERVWSGEHMPPLAEARPSAFRFYYRQSPRPLVPRELNWVVTKRDPLPSWTGETYVALDLEGRLLEFTNQPRQLELASAGPAAAVDWSALVALATAEPGTLREVEPQWTPDVPTDARAAWEGTDRGEPIRVEAAAWRGRPVWLRTIAPWERAERDVASRPIREQMPLAFVAIILIVYLAFAVLARHNLGLGRSDRKGAFRVAAVVFAGFGISRFVGNRWSVDTTEIWTFLVQGYPVGFFAGSGAWVYYLGTEPFLRRHWPHRLVASTRLIEGRLTDPLVGRELLLGILAGAGASATAALGTILGSLWGAEAPPGFLRLGPATEFWSSSAGAVPLGIISALAGFALLLLFRLVLRREAAAWIGLGALWTLLWWQPGHPVVAWLVAASVASIMVFTARAGLLASAVAFAVTSVLSYSPLTLDLHRWYAWRTLVVLGTVLLLALWGFRAASGHRRLLRPEALEA